MPQGVQSFKNSFPLNKLEQQLPSSAFVRSHQSYLVNMGYIQSVARYQLTLSNGLRSEERRVGKECRL